MILLLISPLALIGLIDSGYIYYRKNRQQRLVCSAGEACNNILKTQYSRLFGIPNEILGLIYYQVAIALTLLILGTSSAIATPLMWIFLAISSIALIVSIYLTGIQAFVLKKWCRYCTITNSVNLIIWALVVTNITTPQLFGL